MRKILWFLLIPFMGVSQNIVQDIDGNTYNTVTIGSQIWMKENLKVLRYNNGDSIPCMSNYNTLWDSVGCCSYMEPNLLDLYGRFYNWYAATDFRKLCPTNYHVPTKHDWRVLIKQIQPEIDTLGSLSEGELQLTIESGNTLKNTQNWPIPQNGTNTTGFSAVPAGEYVYWATHPMTGSFWPMISLGQRAVFLCSDDAQLEPQYINNPNLDEWKPTWGLFLQKSAGHFFTSMFWKQSGYSVRCISDSQVVTTNKEPEINQLKSVYPNPFINKIFVNFFGEVKITNTLGEVVYESKSYVPSEIDVSKLKVGVYYLTLIGNSKYPIIKKLIKM